MKRNFWIIAGFVITGILMNVNLSSRVFSYDDPCASCPAGYSCEQTGPNSAICTPPPGNPPPPPAVDCGDASAPSCNGSCSSGQSCVTTSANPNCHCKADANGAPACTAGKSLKAYTPSGTLNNNQCTFPGMCWSFFPSKTINGCDPAEIKAQCSVSYLCCNANQGISCTTGANDTHEIEATVCPAGEMKASARTSHYFNTDGDRIEQYFVTCRRNCGCVDTCSTVAPSKPALVLPGNGITQDSTSVTLDWNAVGSWGTVCPGPHIDRYHVYVGTTNPPTTLANNLPSTTTTAVVLRQETARPSSVSG
jgi:hypothetical protein